MVYVLRSTNSATAGAAGVLHIDASLYQEGTCDNQSSPVE